MKIDITTLLSGGGETLPTVGGLSAENFGLALEERLAELDLAGLITPDVQPELMADILPEALDAQAELSTEPALPEDLATLLADGNPQWQLQQLVARNAVGAESAGRKPVGKEPGSIAPATVPLRSSGKTLTPPSEKLPHLAELAAKPAGAVHTAASVNAEVNGAVSGETALPTATLSMATTSAAIRLPASPQASPTVTVTQPPETPEWKQAVSQHIVTFSRNGIQNAEIRLHPQELGSLQITLRLHQEQAQIHIVSEHAHVRQAMENAMPQLRAAMAESGVQLGQTSVSADNPYSGAGTQSDTSPGQQHAQSDNEDALAEEEVIPTLLTTVPGNIYGINTFA